MTRIVGVLCLILATTILIPFQEVSALGGRGRGMAPVVRLPAPAASASCGTSRVTTNCAPVVANHRVVNAVVTEVITPIAIPVFVPAAVFQYMPALYPQQPQKSEAPALSMEDLDRIIAERIDAALRARVEGGPPTLILPSNAKAVDVNELQQNAANILAKNCAACHTAGVRTAGSVTLFKTSATSPDEYIFDPSVSPAKIWEVVSTARMPIDARGNLNSPKAVPPAEREVLRHWKDVFALRQ